MADVFLMASPGFPTGQRIGFNQEPPPFVMMNRVIRDFQSVPIIEDATPEILRSGSSAVRYNQLEPFSSLIEAKPCLNMESLTKDTVIMDVQGAHFPAFLHGGGIHEHSMSHKEAFRLVNSGSGDVPIGGLSVPVVADLVDLQMKENEINQLSCVPSVLYQSSDNKLISDFIGDLAHNSKIVVDTEGRVLVTHTGVEMKDLLSIVAEFYLSRNSVRNRTISMPIPYFDRKSFGKRRNNDGGSTRKLEDLLVAPVKSPNKSKPKQSQNRKHGRKTSEERDLFKRNYFHACESLLSILMDNNGKGQTALLSLKKSGRELPDLINRFSAGIAGTGLVLVLSVACKVACGRVPICSSKLMSTGIGIGMVWLSWAVNKLRDTVIYISRNASKSGMKEDDVMSEVDRSVKEIYFRVATLMALTALRFV